MLKIGMPIPENAIVALSGGVDSMAILHFLSRRRCGVRAAYFNHGTAHGAEAEQFVTQYCAAAGIPLDVGSLTGERDSRESPEEFWRNRRYAWLDSLGAPIVTAHHLDDNVEQWLFSAMHGKPGTIPPVRNRVIRPFMLTRKSEMVDWCARHSVPHVTDPSNNSTKYMRNKIRHDIMPHALQVNPGLHKVVAKIVLGSYANCGTTQL